jgi:hypothetical protein
VNQVLLDGDVLPLRRYYFLQDVFLLLYQEHQALFEILFFIFYTILEVFLRLEIFAPLRTKIHQEYYT